MIQQVVESTMERPLARMKLDQGSTICGPRPATGPPRDRLFSAPTCVRALTPTLLAPWQKWGTTWQKRGAAWQKGGGASECHAGTSATPFMLPVCLRPHLHMQIGFLIFWTATVPILSQPSGTHWFTGTCAVGRSAG